LKKIALVGTASCGKTTAFDTLAQKSSTKCVLFVPEAARLLARERPELFNHEKLLAERECLIAEKQLQQELEAESTVGCRLIVTDRCILDTYLYCAEAMGCVPGLVKEIFTRLMPSYSRFCLFDPVGIEYVEDRVRKGAADSKFRAQWHKAFLRELELHLGKVVQISGNLTERVNTVERVIMELLDID